MKKEIKLLKLKLAGLTLMLTFSVQAGGPWLHEKGRGFVQAQVVWPAYSYSSLLMGDFIKDTQGVNRETFVADFNFYVEYGITDRLNAISSLPMKYIKTGGLTESLAHPNLLPEGDLFGLSNYRLELKYKLLDKKIKVATSLISAWNTISKDLDKGLATGYEGNAYGLMVHGGRSKEKHYGFVDAGYLFYTHGYSDALELKVEHGWKLKHHLTLAFAFEGRFSMSNGSKFNANLAQTGASPNNQDWAYVGGKLFYERQNGLGFSLAVPMIPIRFKNVGYNGALGIGAFKKF
mgnify:CR=1 FL=1